MSELDVVLGRAEKAVQRLKGYATRIDIPFKKFMRENVIDDAYIMVMIIKILHLSGNEVIEARIISPTLYTGAPVVQDYQ